MLSPEEGAKIKADLAAEKQKNAELTETVEEKDAKIKELSEKIDQQDELIGELNTTIAEKDAEKKSPMPIVKIGGEQYQVTVPKFRFNGEVLTAKDVQDDPKLAKSLLDEKSEVLKLYKDEETK